MVPIILGVVIYTSLFFTLDLQFIHQSNLFYLALRNFPIHPLTFTSITMISNEVFTNSLLTYLFI